MRLMPYLLAILVATLVPAGLRSAAERPSMAPRVPADQLAAARALTSPLPDAPETVERGKALYEGKGACLNCHGPTGGGDGPLAASLDPSPRNFQHHGFWRHRAEGEVFWVIKHWSPGTAMIGFDGQLTDEEIWAVVHYLRQLAGEAGRGRHSRRGRMDRGMGPQGHGGCGRPPGETDCPEGGARHRGPHE